MSATSPARRPLHPRAGRAALGAAFLLVALGAALVLAPGAGSIAPVARRLVDHALIAPTPRRAVFPAGTELEVGAPLRIRRGDGRELIEAGEVTAVRADPEGLTVTLLVYPEFEARLGPDTELVARSSRGDLVWVVETLLPPEKLDEIRAVLLRRWELDRDRLITEITPGLERWAADFLDALRRALPELVERRSAEVDVIGEVLRERGWEGGLEEALRREVWPRARERALPVIASVGDEILDAFPVWTMSWAYMVQKLPFGGDDRVKDELETFLERKVAPILAGREDEFRALALDVAREAIEDPALREALGRAAGDVVSDPRFRSAVVTLLHDGLIENPEIRELAAGLWTRDDLRGPIERFLQRMAPDFHRIANAIVLDDDGRSINPELARVLRRKILGDDEAWILVLPGARRGTAPEPLPGRSPDER